MRNQNSPKFSTAVFTTVFLAVLVMGSSAGLAYRPSVHAEHVFERESESVVRGGLRVFAQGVHSTTPLQNLNETPHRAPALQHVFQHTN